MRGPVMVGQPPLAFAAQITVGAETDQVRRLQVLDLEHEAQRHSDRRAHDDARPTARRHVPACGFGRGESRPPLRPLIDPLEHRPHCVDAGVEAPPVVEVEGLRFPGPRDHMFVAHGTTVV